MSEEDKRQDQHQKSSNHLNIANEVEGGTNRKESTAQRLSNRTARVGALVLQAYQRPQGGISPNKLIVAWIQKLVSFLLGVRRSSPFVVCHGSPNFRASRSISKVNSILADKNTLASSKEALDLLEDVSTAIHLKPGGLEQSLVDQIVGILETHPVCSRGWRL